MERPPLVTATAAVVLASGVVAWISGFGGIATGHSIAGNAAVIILGTVLIMLAWDLWQLRQRALWAIVIVQALNALLASVALFVSLQAVGAWITLVLAAATFLLLATPQVRSALRRPEMR